MKKKAPAGKHYACLHVFTNCYVNEIVLNKGEVNEAIELHDENSQINSNISCVLKKCQQA